MFLKIQFLISFHFLFAFAHYDSAYFRNADDGFRVYNNWLEQIKDDKLLSELALPGTHDSATFTSGSDIVKTQVLTFAEQLEYGIRFFDIRMYHSDNKFILCHDVIDLGLTLDDFLKDVTKFLREHPTEVVLFRLKEDQGPGKNTRSKQETLEEYLDTYEPAYLRRTSIDLTLGEARGKFLIISDNEDFHRYGVSYDNFFKQDDYAVTTNWDLYRKWEAVREHLEEARNGDKNQFYVNFLTGSGGSFPYFIASGHSSPGTSSPRLATGLTTPLFENYYPDFPRVSCFIGMCTIAFEGTNTLTRDYLVKNRPRGRSAGVIVADFPGTDLILTIINDNFFD